MKLGSLLVLGSLMSMIGCKSAAVPAAAPVSGGPAAVPAQVTPTAGQNATPVALTSASFDVDVSLSPAAVADLKKLHELVSVLATLTGRAKPGAPQGIADGTGNVFLANDLHQAGPEKTIRFKDVKLDKAALAATDGSSPQLKVTAGSSILHTENSVFTCTSYDGPLTAVQGKSVAISCKDLGEQD